MITLRLSQDRGRFDAGWITTFHTFSFGTYYDPDFMGVSSLKVLNEVFLSPGSGLPLHPHQDMEIVTLLLSGALHHEDTLQNRLTMTAGSVQLISSGTGTSHREQNLSSQPAHFLECWLVPSVSSTQPNYQQKHFPSSAKVLLVSSDGREGSLRISQKADLYLSHLNKNDAITYNLSLSRQAWIQVLSGAIECKTALLREGDGALIQQEAHIKITSTQPSSFLWIELF